MPLALKQVSRLGEGVRAAPMVRPLLYYSPLGRQKAPECHLEGMAEKNPLVLNVHFGDARVANRALCREVCRVAKART